MNEEAVRFFDGLCAAAPACSQVVESLKPGSSRSIVEALRLAYLRKLLDFIEIPTKEGIAPSGADIWNYWVNRRTEFQQLCATGTEIASYVLPSESKMDIANRAKKKVASLLPVEQVFDSVPVLDRFFAMPGAPVKMRPVAVKALQLKIDKGWSLARITREVCPCRKATHRPNCQQDVRQSIIGLKKLLKRCGIEVPLFGTKISGL